MEEIYSAISQAGVRANTQIKLKSGDVTYKDLKISGGATNSFFVYILRGVCGSSEFYQDRPGVLYLYDKDHNKLISHGIMDEGNPKIRSSTDVLPSASITYHFLIPDTILQKKEIHYFTIESARNNGTVYAEIELQDAILVGDKTNIDIEWTLVIQNYSIL